ncbi:MAG TPA: HAMP domain-containing sensor histidine kinase, partial [Spirochaetia bacterium]|nr:HAMP domain-containing sensor histidine kinase [Spirochaetia bacterium]
ARLVGFGLYGSGNEVQYRWGEIPEPFVPPSFADAEIDNGLARVYRDNPRNGSTVLLVKSPPGPPPGRGRGDPDHPPPGRAPTHPSGTPPSRGMDTLRTASVMYLEVRQPQYWSRSRLQEVLFPVTEACLAGVVTAVTFLVITNLSYRRRIEQQKNLVMLGTAASTIAHEIKNPLLSIRLQSGIISRTLPGQAARELAIIDSEVERLSNLSGRVSDFLRDPVGSPSPVDPVEIAVETGMRLLGRPLVRTPPNPPCRLTIDAERLRSILENLVRNAMESGGPDSEVAVEVRRGNGSIHIDVLDRGTGIAASNRDRVFDPFFTTKSRGTGIGLAICLRFAQAAGARLELLARAHGGTRARLTVPETRP